MKVHEFINTLQENPGKAFTFRINDNVVIAPNAHFTEIKQSSIRSLDCGGKATRWNEAIMQWWTASDADDGHRISSTKVLDIFDRLDRLDDIDRSAELRMEYDENVIGVRSYTLELFSIDRNVISFELAAQTTQCKASKSCGIKLGGCNRQNKKKQVICCS